MDGGKSEPKKENHVQLKEAGDPILEDIMIDIDAVDDFLLTDEAFSSLPDFPCLSPPRLDVAVPPKINSSCSDPLSPHSSSSSSSWNFVADAANAPLQQPDFLDSLLLQDWDPSSLFPAEEGDNNSNSGMAQSLDHQNGKEKEGDAGVSDELGEVFLEWLKNNRDAISPEDLRSIKLKKSTIECAAARLGEGRQGRMQLVKLILSWVQNNHLEKRRKQQQAATSARSETDSAPIAQQQPVLVPVPSAPAGNGPLSPNPSPGFDCSFDELGYHNYNPWGHYQPVVDPLMVPNGVAADMPGFYYPSGGSGSSGGGGGFNSQPFSPVVPDFHGFSPARMGYPPYQQPIQMQPPVQYPPGGILYPATSPGGTSSATKEARKKRMARQRRYSTLHPNTSSTAQQQPPNPYAHQLHAAAVAGGGCSSSSSNASSRSWALLSSPSPSPTPPTPTPPTPTPTPTPTPSSPCGVKSAAANAPPACASNMQKKRNASAASDKQQNWKSEKNLRFLLQKVLKQSDVGSLGRIVLPKKEAESHLPVLNARDGITIPMEDIGTSRVWNMRYRYWPNNKSRMYLLENTGDFVRANGLQEGDFIVIYSDVKCNKYMIRGVKVRSPPEAKVAAGSNRSTGKAQRKKKALESSSSSRRINSIAKVASSGSSESSEGDVMELLADGEDEDVASPSIIKIDA